MIIDEIFTEKKRKAFETRERHVYLQHDATMSTTAQRNAAQDSAGSAVQYVHSHVPRYLSKCGVEYVVLGIPCVDSRPVRFPCGE